MIEVAAILDQSTHSMTVGDLAAVMGLEFSQHRLALQHDRQTGLSLGDKRGIGFNSPGLTATLLSFRRNSLSLDREGHPRRLCQTKRYTSA